MISNNSRDRRRPSIAIVGSRGIPANYGGFETIAEELGTKLAKEKFEVYVSCENRELRPKAYNTYKGMQLVYFPVIDSLRSISESVLYDLLSVIWATLRVDVIYMLGYSMRLL